MTVSGLEGCEQIKHKQEELCMMVSNLMQQQDLYTNSITAHLRRERAVQAENTAGCLMRKQQLAGSQLDGNPKCCIDALPASRQCVASMLCAPVASTCSGRACSASGVIITGQYAKRMLVASHLCG